MTNSSIVAIAAALDAGVMFVFTVASNPSKR
jgi:hypothetical protein